MRGVLDRDARGEKHGYKNRTFCFASNNILHIDISKGRFRLQNMINPCATNGVLFSVIIGSSDQIGEGGLMYCYAIKSEG